MMPLYTGRVVRLLLTVGRGAYVMEAGMIVQMAIAWTTLCVLFKRKRHVYHTEASNTYYSNRDVPTPFEMQMHQKVTLLSGHELCYALDPFPIRQSTKMGMNPYHVQGIVN